MLRVVRGRFFKWLLTKGTCVLKYLMINHFAMYYSNLQVNYMVTVFIRLVIAVVYTLHLLSCSKCFVCLCLFQYRHCFLVGWCTNKSYVIATSDLWLFIHASNLLSLYSPSPLPYICMNLLLFYVWLLWSINFCFGPVEIRQFKNNFNGLKIDWGSPHGCSYLRNV